MKFHQIEMGETLYVSSTREHQDTLDKANQAYYNVCLENNDYVYPPVEDVYEALMLAWEYITDTTRQVVKS